MNKEEAIAVAVFIYVFILFLAVIVVTIVLNCYALCNILMDHNETYCMHQCLIPDKEVIMFLSYFVSIGFIALIVSLVLIIIVYDKNPRPDW